MKILLLGKNGQLGWELQRTLAPLGPVVALGFEDLRLEDFDAVRWTIRELRPQVIINASAYTAVDRAESEPEKAYAINEKIPGILAEECVALKATLIHYSTDYVFDGKKGMPYTEEDTPNPLSIYGKSKLAGEQAIQSEGSAYLILRTSWVYSLRRDSFVTKVLQWARQNKILRIVNDQISNPTWARMLAEASTQVLARSDVHPTDYFGERSGVYHLSGYGHASRLEWAQAILKLDTKPKEQTVEQIVPVLTSDFPAAASRPLFSALDCSKFEKTFDLCLPAWEATLELALDINNGSIGDVEKD